MTIAVTSAVRLDDTIVAAATPNGRGALALIRLSGRDAFSIAARHLRPVPSQPRVSQLCSVHDGDELLDQALVTLFPGPNSFTGEDTVELSTHGGYLVPDSVIAALISSGARRHSRGIHQRAVLNSKLDILQAEAIGDLIEHGHSHARTALGSWMEAIPSASAAAEQSHDLEALSPTNRLSEEMMDRYRGRR